MRVKNRDRMFDLLCGALRLIGDVKGAAAVCTDLATGTSAPFGWTTESWTSTVSLTAVGSSEKNQNIQQVRSPPTMRNRLDDRYS